MAIPQAIPDWTLQQYMTGSPGQSPALQSGVDAFNMAQMNFAMESGGHDDGRF